MIKVADFLREILLKFCKKEVNDSKRNSMKRGSKRRASSRFSIQAAESHESPTRWTNVYTLFSISSRMIIAAGILSPKLPRDNCLFRTFCVGTDVKVH